MTVLDTLIRAELPSVDLLLETHPDFFDEAIAPIGAAEFVGCVTHFIALESLAYR